MNADRKQLESSVKSLIYQDAYRKRFEEVLGNRANQFMASVVNSSMQSGLEDCEPKSIIAASFVAATLDLPIDRNLGFAYIVPYKKIGQFQIGYKGLIQLALRSGQYLRMNAKPINKEAFAGFDEYGEPIIKWENLDESQEPIGYAFIWKLSSGFSKREFWTKERIDLHAKRYSQAFRQDRKESPWFTNYEEMALKTVIKQSLRQWGILSIQMQYAIEQEEGEFVVQEIQTSQEDSKPQKQVTPLQELNQKIREANPHIQSVNQTIETPAQSGGEVKFEETKTEDHPVIHHASNVERSAVQPMVHQGTQKTETIKKDAETRKAQKQAARLRMEIQGQLFLLAHNDDERDELLQSVSMNTKCGMGETSLTFKDLATCENIAWLKEIEEELSQMERE